MINNNIVVVVVVVDYTSVDYLTLTEDAESTTHPSLPPCSLLLASLCSCPRSCSSPSSFSAHVLFSSVHTSPYFVLAFCSRLARLSDPSHQRMFLLFTFSPYASIHSFFSSRNLSSFLIASVHNDSDFIHVAFYCSPKCCSFRSGVAVCSSVLHICE